MHLSNNGRVDENCLFSYNLFTLSGNQKFTFRLRFRLRTRLRRTGKVKFSENTDLETRISENTCGVKSLIGKITKNMAKISRDDKIHISVRNNINQSLSLRFQKTLTKFSNIEKKYSDSLKNRKSVDKFFDDKNNKNDIQGATIQNYDQDQVLLNDNYVVEVRSNEIQKIAESINELALLFKQLNGMVIEQGTLVDRIDQNIDNVYEKTKKGTSEIRKANEHSKLSILCRCIGLLFVVILCLTIALIIKFV